MEEGQEVDAEGGEVVEELEGGRKGGREGGREEGRE